MVEFEQRTTCPCQAGGLLLIFSEKQPNSSKNVAEGAAGNEWLEHPAAEKGQEDLDSSVGHKVLHQGEQRSEFWHSLPKLSQ